VACTAYAVQSYNDQSTHPAGSSSGAGTNKGFHLHDKVQIKRGGNWLDGEIVRTMVEPTTQDVATQEAFCNQFLDENGGYTNKSGGRFDVMAGTYTTKEGSIRDQYGWQDPDGSYRNNQLDFYEASTHRFHFANGQVLTKPKVTAEQGKQALQELARDYPKDYFSIAIAQRVAIMKEHPAEAAAFHTIDGMLYQVQISGNRVLWTIAQNLRPLPATPEAAPKPVQR
jgi:hypothetical protein